MITLLNSTIYVYYYNGLDSSIQRSTWQEIKYNCLDWVLYLLYQKAKQGYLMSQVKFTTTKKVNDKKIKDNYLYVGL